MWKQFKMVANKSAIRNYTGNSQRAPFDKEICVVMPTYKDEEQEDYMKALTEHWVIKKEDPNGNIYTIGGAYGYKIKDIKTVDFPDKDKVNILLQRNIEKMEEKKKKNGSLSLTIQVKKMSGAPSLDCKKAVTEVLNKGITVEEEIIEQALCILYENQKTKKITKSLSKLNSGLAIADVSFNKDRGTIIALGCQSDEAAKTDEFIKLSDDILIIANNNIPKSTIDLLTLDYDEDYSIAEAIENLSKKLREEIRLLHYSYLKIPCEGYEVEMYSHTPTLKLACIGMFKNENKLENRSNFHRDILMQIAAYNPLCNKEEDLLPEIINNQQAIIIEEIEKTPKFANKNLDVKKKVAENILDNFMKEVVLEKQKLSTHPKEENVKSFMNKNNITLLDFERFKIE